MPEPQGAARPVLRLLAVSVAAGLLVAAIALPLVGSLGLAAKAGADTFESLPTDLNAPPLPQRTTLLAADGRPIASFFDQDRRAVDLAQVPAVMQRAIVDIEDSRFWEHNGVDLRGVMRAAVRDLGAGSAAQGGSTITQQYVKNVLMQKRETDQGKQAVLAPSLSRKVRELRYAVALAAKMPKREVLQRYLNIVYFGDGAYGVASAARHFFGVPVQRLTLTQAALLAGLVQDPGGYNPRLHPQAAKQRRDTVLARMHELGHLADATYGRAVRAPLGLRVQPARNGCAASWAPFYCDYVVAQLLADPALGRTEEQRRSALLRGGLVVRTTLDPKAQAAAQQAAQTTVPGSSRLGAAVVVVEPGTGAVRAMAVNRPYGHGAGQTEVNYATGGTTGFQPGSTFKVFLLAAALEQGVPLGEVRHAPTVYDSQKYKYRVKNAGDSEAGTFTLLQATWLSVNTYFIQLEEQVGIDPAARVAEALGLRRFPDRRLDRYPSFFLGAQEVSPLSMAAAYAAFAAHGTYCAPYGVTSRTVAGHEQRTTPQCRRALPAKVADTMSGVLRGVIDGPDPARTGVRAAIGRPAAGKTGTTDNFGAAWFVGYTPQLATAVWVGDPRGAAHPLTDVTVAGQHYQHVYGGDLPALAWSRTMRAALAGVPVAPMPPMITRVPSAGGGSRPGKTGSAKPAPPPSGNQPGPGKKKRKHHP